MQIPTIMSMLIFQNSRRQLLATLMDTFDAAEKHRDEHKTEGKPEGEAEARRIDNLLKAVKAADVECKKLEYWSDIRRRVDGTRHGRASMIAGQSTLHGRRNHLSHLKAFNSFPLFLHSQQPGP
jgi:hypothetical protein